MNKLSITRLEEIAIKLCDPEEEGTREEIVAITRRAQIVIRAVLDQVEFDMSDVTMVILRNDLEDIL